MVAPHGVEGNSGLVRENRCEAVGFLMAHNHESVGS
jgi:hypothetical protein